MARSKRKEFTERTRAQIFARDKALCAFSGKSLWVLDYGASPDWDWDWVDHIKPATKGGDASLENGICASSFYNAKKGNNSRDNAFFYHEGRPQPALIWFFGKVHHAQLDHIERFNQIHFSDWYLNRAFAYLLLAVGWMKTRDEGKTKKRDLEYYSKAANKKLKQWRNLVQKYSVEPFERRKLSNEDQDVQTMIGITRAENVADISDIAHKLLSIYKANSAALEELVRYSLEPNIDYNRALIFSKPVSQRVKNNILQSIKRE